MQTRYELLQIKEYYRELIATNPGAEELADGIEYKLDSMRKRFRGVGNYPPEKNQPFIRKGDLMYCLDVVLYRHLQLPIGSTDVARFVREGAQIAVDYFYGDWMKLDKDYADMMRKSPKNEDLSWYKMYRDGLFLAFLAEDAGAERKLLEWIEPKLPFDESSLLVTVHDNNVHKLLAEYLKDGEVSSKGLERKTQACKKRRPKLLLACFDAIRAGDEKAFGAAMKKYLSYFIKSEFGLTSFISIDGSIFWHVAQRAGLDATGLSDREQALIVTRESLEL